MAGCQGLFIVINKTNIKIKYFFILSFCLPSFFPKNTLSLTNVLHFKQLITTIFYTTLALLNLLLINPPPLLSHVDCTVRSLSTASGWGYAALFNSLLSVKLISRDNKDAIPPWQCMNHHWEDKFSLSCLCEASLHQSTFIISALKTN